MPRFHGFDAKVQFPQGMEPNIFYAFLIFPLVLLKYQHWMGKLPWKHICAQQRIIPSHLRLCIMPKFKLPCRITHWFVDILKPWIWNLWPLPCYLWARADHIWTRWWSCGALLRLYLDWICRTMQGRNVVVLNQVLFCAPCTLSTSHPLVSSAFLDTQRALWHLWLSVKPSL